MVRLSFRFFAFLVFFRLNHALHFGEVEVGDGVLEDTTRTEQDAGFLDERIVEILFLEGALGADAHAEGSNVHEADDFSLLDGFGNHIFERYEYGVHIGLGYGTTALDSLRHLTDVDVATGLHIAVELRFGFTVTRVDFRYNGVGYGSCHFFLKVKGYRLRVKGYRLRVNGFSPQSFRSFTELFCFPPDGT